MKNKNIITSILFYLIAFIVLIHCAKILFEEQTYLDVNENNRQSISEALSEMINNDSPIVKVSIGNGFHSGEFHVYYKSGEREKFIITEGSRVGKVDGHYIDGYVRENGYNYDYIAVTIAMIVVILVVVVTIIKIIFSIKRKIYNLRKS